MNKQPKNNSSKEKFYAQEEKDDTNATNLSPDANKAKIDKAMRHQKNTNNLNQNMASTHVKFTEFTNYIV